MPAKKASSTSKSNSKQEWYNSKTDSVLLYNAKFVYDVEVYQYGRVFSLYDSKYISSEEHTPNETIWFKKEGVQFKSVTVLVAAPKKWLESNNYKLKEE